MATFKRLWARAGAAVAAMTVRIRISISLPGNRVFFIVNLLKAEAFKF